VDTPPLKLFHILVTSSGLSKWGRRLSKEGKLLSQKKPGSGVGKDAIPKSLWRKKEPKTLRRACTTGVQKVRGRDAEQRAKMY